METLTAVMSSVIATPSQDNLALVSDLSVNQATSLPVTSVIDQMLQAPSDHIAKKSSAVREQLPAPPVKRGRGRPPKKRPTNEPPPPSVKRKRGRPRKNPVTTVDTQPVVSGQTAIKQQDKLSVEKMAERLAIATAIEQSGLSKQNESGGDDSSAATMNIISTTGPRKRGRPRKRPLESYEQPRPAKRSKEMTSSGRSPQLLQAEKPTLLFALPECEVTKARVDIDLVEGPSFQSNTTHTVVVNLKESSPPQTAPPPSNTVVKRGRGRPPKKDTTANTVTKRGRGRPPGSVTKKGKYLNSATERETPSAGIKRGRGRPRKYPLQDTTPPQNHSQDNSTATPPKRKRGRPPKTPVAKQQTQSDETANLKEHSDVGVVKRGRGRPRKPRPLEESVPPAANKPKRGRGRPRKNRPPNISQLAEQILLPKDNSSIDQNEDPLPSVGGVVIQHNNERGIVIEKRKRGRPRKHPIPSPKPPGIKRGRGRPRIHPVVQPGTDDICKTPSSPVANSEPVKPLESPMLAMDISPLKKVIDSIKEAQTSGTVAETGNEGFKLHMSFSDSDSDCSEGMGVQDTDIQELAERVTPPSLHPIIAADERDSPLLGSRFEESFDEDSDTETNK